MASLLSLPPLTLLLSLASLSLMNTSEAQGIKSTRLLDLLIRDYTFHSYTKYFRTGTLHSVNLPGNLSGIGVHTARFRCGSLKRYGAQVKEFNLGIGVTVHPCVERVMLVTQNLGLNWSSIYYDNYELSGYQLISPVLGLLAYNGGDDLNFSNPFEIGILAGKDPISIDFSNTDIVHDTKGLIPLCASFGHDGKVTLADQVAQNVCFTTGHGHFGLVIESPLVPGRRRESRWKVVFGSSVGAALGAFLLSLLVIALFVKVKKKARMEEMERRAYEEEALQVTMVGHVRALTAPVTRTTPAIEHEYRPSPS
ncbi:uncharacterized protein LOC130752836 [Actinidia eriantha]|uniref:uncharacterized protein LOC130752836 n=1 Tax=Actinidia eriantha TaxID=165200 RepID=UPI00259016D9|nr:uncharacterized protein LOC130752836 [Actinidia eriantha]